MPGWRLRRFDRGRGGRRGAFCSVLLDEVEARQDVGRYEVGRWGSQSEGWIGWC